jgi:hypothetical protein
MNLLVKIKNFGSKFIDYKMGIYGAFVMGAVVFGINFSSGEISGALTAAFKQGSYTFLFGGILMKGCELIATRIKKLPIALVASVLVPSVVTLLLTFGMHNLKGTPRPLASTIPTTIIIPATAIWGYKKRKEKDRESLQIERIQA